MTRASEKKILVVDDEPDVRSFLAACIEEAGFKVEIAINGVDALEKVKVDPPDLITLDMAMPRRSGIRIMRELKQNEKWAEIPVIVITVHARDEFGSRYMEEFSVFTDQHCPRYIFEELITPDRLVKSICEILEVETAKADDLSDHPSADREDLLKMIREMDVGTLKRVRNLLIDK